MRVLTISEEIDPEHEITPLEEVSKWTEQYRHIWEARFNQMDDYINQLTNKETNYE